MSRYYQKYFEDYEEDRVPNKYGKGTHLKYTYKGYYYKQEMNCAHQALLRICYVILFLSEFYFFGKAGTKLIYCNTNPIMAVFQSLNMLCYVWLGWIVAFYIFAPRNMTIYKYKSTAIQLKKAQKISMILSLGMLFTAIVLTIICDGISIVAMKELKEYVIVCALGIFWMLIEKSIKYKKVYNCAGCLGNDSKQF